MMNQDKNDTRQATGADESSRKKRRVRVSYSTGGGGNKGRRWLLLAVDILLLAAIVAAIVFLVTLLTPVSLFDTSDVEQKQLTYTVELAGLEASVVEAFRVGDSVTDKETGSVIGTITAVDTRPYEVYSTTDYVENGTLDLNEVLKVTYPDAYRTVTVTVTVTADYTAGVGFAVEDCRIAVGREYELRFPGYTGNGVCIGFKEVA